MEDLLTRFTAHPIQTYFDLGAAALLIVLTIILLAKYRISKRGILLYIIGYALLVCAFIFNLDLTFYIILSVMFAMNLVLVFSNIISFRKIFSKRIKTKVIHNENPGEKIYDSKSLYKTILDTVTYCSKAKMGAIMTFEKDDDLKNVCKNGTEINAPVTQELLITIFYPGTRLHDGAVIIRKNQIIAASVYYTPTTKALTGKYGSRHRAAIGISEITDAVTVVVSEETGRVSIAYDGELESIQLDKFVSKFSEYMEERKDNK